MAIERDSGKPKAASRSAGYCGDPMASAICRLVESRAWALKCAILGAFQLVPLIGWSVSAGHAGAWALDAIDGDDTGLPPAPFGYGIGETIIMGAKSTIIALARTLPAAALAAIALAIGGTLDIGAWAGGIKVPFADASWHYGTQDATRMTISHALLALSALYCALAFPRHLAGTCRMADTGRVSDGLDGRWAWRFVRENRGAMSCAAATLALCGVAGCAYAVIGTAAEWAIGMAGAPGAAIWAVRAVLAIAASGVCYLAMACALRAYGSMLREWAPDEDEDG